MREKSGHGKNMNERGALTNCQTQRERSRQNEASERGPLTNYQAHRGGQAMTLEEREQARVTHNLSRAEEARGQGMESNESARGTHDLSRGKGTANSEDGRTASQAKGAHDLWSGERGESKGTERTQAREAYSQAV
jgi:hypothetical protein